MKMGCNTHCLETAGGLAKRIVDMATSHTRHEIASNLGITEDHVRKILKRYNVSSIKKTASLVVFDEIQKEVKDKIVLSYTAGEAVCLISDRTGVSVVLVNRILAEAGVLLRSYKEEDYCCICGILFEESNTPAEGFPFAPQLCQYCLSDVCRKLGIDVIPKLFSREQKEVIALYVVDWCNSIEKDRNNREKTNKTISRAKRMISIRKNRKHI